MKRFLSALLFASAVAFAASPVVFASDADLDVDITIEEDVDTIDDAASTPDGQEAVIDRIEKEFGVDEALIQELRDKRFGFGEISIALSLAERLPGGLTPENIEKVVAMREGSPKSGWGNIARELGLKINPAADRLDKVADETSGSEARTERVKHERAMKAERTEKAERIEKASRPDRVERVEKVERVERPERGGRK